MEGNAIDLELLQDELEYLELKSNFFDGQTEEWSNLIHDQELKDQESLEEEQELVKVFNERKIEKEKLISHLKALKDQVDTKASKGTKNLIRKNGFFECSECPYKSKWKRNVDRHINNIHFKLNMFVDNKFLDCPECHFKSNFRYRLVQHINVIHRKLRPFKCLDCDKGLFDDI